VISYKTQEKRYSDNEGLNKENESEYFSPENIQEIQNLASHPNIYENLVNSLAPSIWGNDDLKKGVLCMLFGGT
jgi:DNA replication licensing factor MCM4